MSDETAKEFEQEVAKSVAPPTGQSVTLSVTLHPNRQVEFRLPANELLAYGLLGKAQEQLVVLRVLREIQQANAKMKHGNGFPGLLKRMSKGG